MLDSAGHLAPHLEDILPHLNALLGDRMEHSREFLEVPCKLLSACEDTRRPTKPGRNSGKDGDRLDPLDPFRMFWCLRLFRLSSFRDLARRWLLKGLSFRAPLVSNLNDDGPAPYSHHRIHRESPTVLHVFICCF